MLAGPIWYLFDEGISYHDMYIIDPVHRVINISPNTSGT